MALQKNDIPILEYDDNPRAVLLPEHSGVCFPEKAVFPFLADEINDYAKANGWEVIDVFESVTKPFPIYAATHRGHRVCLCQAPVGASAATAILDYLIGNGVRQIISTGSCGCLLDFPENKMLVPTQALRCEGTSYHYLPPSRSVSLHPQAIAAIRKTLAAHQIAYQECMTWTTDGFFRETADMVRHRIAEGCQVVEMECAALAACAAFRGAQFGQILFTADSLAAIVQHEERDWGVSSRNLALQISLDAVTCIV